MKILQLQIGTQKDIEIFNGLLTFFTTVERRLNHRKAGFVFGCMLIVLWGIFKSYWHTATAKQTSVIPKSQEQLGYLKNCLNAFVFGNKNRVGFSNALALAMDELIAGTPFWDF